MKLQACTNCGAQFDVSAFTPGQEFSCGACGTVLIAHQAAPAAPQAAAPKAPPPKPVLPPPGSRFFGGARVGPNGRFESSSQSSLAREEEGGSQKTQSTTASMTVVNVN